VPLAGAAPRAAETKTISIKDFAFDPKTISVNVGDTITWTNEGPSPHTVTADDGSFDAGNLDKGATFSHTFDKAGTLWFTGQSGVYGRVTDYLYDGSNRLRQELQYPSWPATTPTLVTTYGYDGNGNRLTLAMVRHQAEQASFQVNAELAHRGGVEFVSQVLKETLDEPVDAAITTSAGSGVCSTSKPRSSTCRY
jgi:hypothetical protein